MHSYVKQHIMSNIVLTYVVLLLQTGHWTFECKGQAAYQARPSATKQLHNPVRPCIALKRVCFADM